SSSSTTITRVGRSDGCMAELRAVVEHWGSQLGHEPPERCHLGRELSPDAERELVRCVELAVTERIRKEVERERGCGQALDRAVVEVRRDAAPLRLGTPGGARKELDAVVPCARKPRERDAELLASPTGPAVDVSERCEQDRDRGSGADGFLLLKAKRGRDRAGRSSPCCEQGEERRRKPRPPLG